MSAILADVRLTLRFMAAALLSSRDLVLASLTKTVMGFHFAIDGPGSPCACRAHKQATTWPCAEWMDAAEGKAEADQRVKQRLDAALSP